MAEQLNCLRCGYRWQARLDHHPNQCPKCRSYYFDTPAHGQRHEVQLEKPEGSAGRAAMLRYPVVETSQSALLQGPGGCPRCGGFVVAEQGIYDKGWFLRCYQCGADRELLLGEQVTSR